MIDLLIPVRLPVGQARTVENKPGRRSPRSGERAERGEQQTMATPTITIYGTTWCSDCKRAKRFLGEQRVRYNWVDVESDPEGLAFIEQAQNGGHSVPTVRFDDGAVLIEPS